MATFNIAVETVSGDDQTYQWRKNKVDIPGAILSTYTIQNVALTDEGMYCCVVSNAAGLVMSNSAQLTVCKPIDNNFW